jgi:hypothetical protein
MKHRSHIFTAILLALGFLALSPKAQAVVPAPDGGYPGGNTAEGQNALLSRTTGSFNTANGWLSLRALTTGSFNTAVGAGTLALNTADENTATGTAALLFNATGSQNTANGAFALFSNTIGNQNTGTGDRALFRHTEGLRNTAHGFVALNNNTTGDDNTAVGSQALVINTEGNSNTAVGSQALFFNGAGDNNTAIGDSALFNNTIGNANTATGAAALAANTAGENNTAIGFQALFANTTSNENTAIGYQALSSATDGEANTAVGFRALALSTGAANTAIGDSALVNTTGQYNVAAGLLAGYNQTNGDGNVYIGAFMEGVAGESEHTYIRNINSTSVSGGGTDTVTVNLSTGLLGHMSSSRRYKEDIKPMNDTSQMLYRLTPVTYRYKKEIDSTQSPAFGLIAEEVAEVNPDLVASNAEGQPESVHYEMVNAMLLNEFLKEHKRVEEQQSTIAQLQKDFHVASAQQHKEIRLLTAQLRQQGAQLQTVSAQIEIGRSTPQVVANQP